MNKKIKIPVLFFMLNVFNVLFCVIKESFSDYCTWYYDNGYEIQAVCDYYSDA